MESQKSQHLTFKGQNISYNILKGHIKQPVFIKVFQKEKAPDFDNFFQEEIEKFTQLQNGGVIKLLDHIETDTHGYLVFSKFNEEKQSVGKKSMSKICIGIGIAFCIFSILVSLNDTKNEITTSKNHLSKSKYRH